MKSSFKAIAVLGLLIYSVNAAPARVVTFFIKTVPQNGLHQEDVHPEALNFTYFGHRMSLDLNRQVTFPIKTTDDTFFLLITTQAKPVFMIFNTIDHWELEPGARYSLFSIKKMYDEETKLYFWSVEKSEIKDNLVIPMNTILAHVDPATLYIPTGITLIGNNSAQLQLPDIYRKPRASLIEGKVVSDIFAYNTAEFVGNGQFFSKIERSHEVTSTSQQSKI